MSSHVCPRCGKRGPVQLRDGQVCHNCKSHFAWSSFATGNQGITISPDTLAEPDAKPAAPKKPPVVKASTGTWALLISSLVVSAAVIVLLVYFFRHQPANGLSGVSILNRFNTLALIAGALALVAVGLSAGAGYLGVQKKYGQNTFRITGAVSIVFGVAVLLAALFCWSRTERVRSLSAVIPQSTSNDAMVQRVQHATVVVQAHNPQTTRYRSEKRGGIIIASQAGRIFILTVPFFDANGPTLPNDLWVNFTDGRTLPGRFRFATTSSLAIVEVEGENPPAQAQFHPTAEAIIPSQSVLVVPNPIYGWRYEKATVLSRFGGRTNAGWSCVVTLDLGLRAMDLGSAIYDESGRLLGIMTSLGDDRDDSKFVILDSATVSEIEKIRQAKL